MMSRAIVAVALVMIAPAILMAADRTPTIGVGDQVLITMRGDLAKAYRRLSDSRQVDDQPIEVAGAITQDCGDGRYRIENHCRIQNDSKPPILVSLSTTIDASQLKTQVSLRPVSRQIPGSVTPAVFTRREQSHLRVELSQLTCARLQRWTLENEVAHR